MFQSGSGQAQTWALATDENAWQAPSESGWGMTMGMGQQHHQMSMDPLTQHSRLVAQGTPHPYFGNGPTSEQIGMPQYGMGIPPSQMMMRTAPYYPSEEQLVYQSGTPLYMPMGGDDGADQNGAISPDDFVSVTSSNWSSAITQAHGRQDMLASKKKSPAQVAIEDQLNSQSLYKTELCRSFEETGVCRYGNKCQFAHGKDELRPVLRHPKYKTEICRTFQNTGTCPYGKRCRFIHQTADEGNVNSINIIPWSKNVDGSDSGSESSGECSEDELANEEVGDIAVKEITEKVEAMTVRDKKASKPQKNAKPAKAPKEVKGTKGRRNDKKKSNTAGSKNREGDDSKSAKDKKSNKRRLAFFARLSGDTNNANAAANAAANGNAPASSPNTPATADSSAQTAAQSS